MDNAKWQAYLELKKEVKKGIKKLLKSKVLKDKSSGTIENYMEVKYKEHKNVKGLVRVLLSDLTWAKKLKCVEGQYSENDS